MPLQHEHTLNSVTALAFYRQTDGTELLIAGEGSYIRIFEVTSLKPLLHVKVFNTQTIHGISVKENSPSQSDLEVIIWGGASYALLTRHDVDLLLLRQFGSLVHLEQNAPDWILDGVISHAPGQERSCIFVTAHSAALHICLTDNSAQPQLNQLSSPSRSVLYSAAIAWTSDSTFMVAAGTVFGEIEIILWSIDSELGRILYTFTGHEGSIFGVSISPELLDADGKSVRLLASCSDDRTVRIWEVGLPSRDEKASVSHNNSDTFMRETGFGHNLAKSDVEDSQSQCLAMRMGHISRIWGVKFLVPTDRALFTYNDINVLSFGEDATVHQWRLDVESSGSSRVDPNSKNKANETTKTTLNLAKVFSYHSGKHLWSSALLSSNSSKCQLATGGADGKISIYPVSIEKICEKKDEKRRLPSRTSSDGEKGAKGQADRLSASQSWSLEDILSSAAPRSESSGANGHPDIIVSENPNIVKNNTKPWKDAMNQFIFITPDLLLVTTWSKHLLIGPYQGDREWKELDLGNQTRPDSRSYWELASIPEMGIAFAGCINTGVVYFIAPDYRPLEIFQTEGKLVGLLPISEPGDKVCKVLVMTADCLEAKVLSVDLTSFEIPSLDSTKTVNLPAKFVVKSARVMRNLLILGSREGYIAIYDFTVEPERSPELLHTSRLPGNETVTAIVPVPSTNEFGDLHFLATTRDGTYSVLSISRATSTISLVHQGSLPFGPWIEAAWFEHSKLFLYGFRSKNFVVWNETDQVEVMSVDCGGAHRNIAYSSLGNSTNGGAGNFAYTRAARLHLYSQARPSHQIVKRGGHGREIKAGAVLQEKSLLATGAEDTSIRLWRFRSTESSKVDDYECCAVIDKHVTGIQDLQWSHLEGHFTYLFSAAGYEEFYVWAISDVPRFGLGVICEATLEDISEEHDLRIMAFDVLPNPNIKYPQMNTVVGDCHLVCLAFSDSTIKVYLYSKEMGFYKISHGRYTSSCLTQLKILPYESKHGHRLLTASTDGDLALWNFPTSSSSIPTPELILLSRTPAHQSSILALDVLHLSQNKNADAFIIATGGDDNSIALTFFYDWKPTRRLLVPSAHAAAVTGLSFVQQQGTSRDPRQHSICTVGEDQKVKRWKIELVYGDGEEELVGMDINILEMGQEDEVASSVADPAGLVVFGALDRTGIHDTSDDGNAQCLVYGNGLESFRVVDG